jgi:hypothetical protein
MGKGSEHPGHSMTYTDLREILRVNFELYKDEPDFFDYITTLVIYLMEYEYKGDRPDVEEPPPESLKLQKIHAIGSRYQVRDGRCPLCNNPVPLDRNICPFCMAMVKH